MTLWGARCGDQIIQCPAARAFDRQTHKRAFGEFFAAVAAADVFHGLQGPYRFGSLGVPVQVARPWPNLQLISARAGRVRRSNA